MANCTCVCTWLVDKGHTPTPSDGPGTSLGRQARHPSSHPALHGNSPREGSDRRFSRASAQPQETGAQDTVAGTVCRADVH